MKLIERLQMESDLLREQHNQVKLQQGDLHQQQLKQQQLEASSKISELMSHHRSIADAVDALGRQMLATHESVENAQLMAHK